MKLYKFIIAIALVISLSACDTVDDLDQFVDDAKELADDAKDLADSIDTSKFTDDSTDEESYEEDSYDEEYYEEETNETVFPDKEADEIIPILDDPIDYFDIKADGSFTANFYTNMVFDDVVTYYTDIMKDLPEFSDVTYNSSEVHSVILYVIDAKYDIQVIVVEEEETTSVSITVINTLE